MNNELSRYLSENQYNKICKYWNVVNNLNKKIKHFERINYKNYMDYEYSDDDDEYKQICITNNQNIDNARENLTDELNYYEKEYVKYLNKIGLRLNDQTQNEHLFNLLNNGILLN